MTGQPDAAAEQGILLTLPSAYFTLQCSTVSVFALVVYDWVVSLSREVDLFWSGKARPLSAALYFSNRYLNVLPYVVSAVQMAPISDKNCTNFVIAFRVLLYFSYLPPSAFTALRAYALTRCRWLSIFVFLLLSAPFFTNMVALTLHRVVGLHFQTWGCLGAATSYWSSLLSENTFIVNRALAILADTILIVITWTFLPAPAITGDAAPAGRIRGKPNALASIMLCNGMIYFIALSLINIFQLVLVVGFSLTPYGLTILYFASPLSSVLVSHFLLDLQEAHQRTVAGGVTSNGSLNISRILLGSINLGDALGSIGAIVDPTADYVLEEDNESEGVAAYNDRIPAAESIHPGEGEAIHDP